MDVAGESRWLQGQNEGTLPGGCGSKSGKPQRASRVVPQSKGDKWLPALGGFHLCYDKQTKKSINIYSVSCVETEAREKELQAY